MARDLGLAAIVVLVVSIWLGLCNRVAIGDDRISFAAPDDRPVFRVETQWAAPLSWPWSLWTEQAWVDLPTADPEPSTRCYTTTVPDFDDGYARIRVWVEGGGIAPSEWTRAFPVPEPTVRVALMLGLLALAALGRRR